MVAVVYGWGLLFGYFQKPEVALFALNFIAQGLVYFSMAGAFLGAQWSFRRKRPWWGVLFIALTIAIPIAVVSYVVSLARGPV